MIDSSVLIASERSSEELAALDARLGGEPAAIAAITASELLHGCHRANTAARRRKRQAFVESILSLLPVIPFDLAVARVHAEAWAALARGGNVIGAHDLLIAATALAHGLKVATKDLRHFRRIADLQVEVW